MTILDKSVPCPLCGGLEFVRLLDRTTEPCSECVNPCDKCRGAKRIAKYSQDEHGFLQVHYHDCPTCRPHNGEPEGDTP